jgi:hypothetical protein
LGKTCSWEVHVVIGVRGRTREDAVVVAQKVLADAEIADYVEIHEVREHG